MKVKEMEVLSYPCESGVMHIFQTMGSAIEQLKTILVKLLTFQYIVQSSRIIVIIEKTRK